MSNVMPILKKELRSYFASPMAYIVLTVFVLICSIAFAITLFVSKQASLRSVFATNPYFFTIFVPAITMRLVAEEKKTGTFELLMTMPVSNIEVILGKFLASLVLLAVALGVTGIHALTIAALGDADQGATFAGYLGLLLLGAGYMAIGILTSSLTENQIVAFLVSFFVILILSFIDKVLLFFPAAFASVFEYLSAEYHFNNIARGVLDSRDLVYYASLVVIGLYFSARALHRRL